MTSSELKKSKHPDATESDALLTDYLKRMRKETMKPFVNEYPEILTTAVEFALTDRLPFSWRAAWLINNTMEYNDARILPKAGKIISYIPEAPDNQRRELLKILFHLQLTKNQKMKLFTVCGRLWKDIALESSVRGTALQMILSICGDFPALNTELELLLTEQYLSTLTPGIRKSLLNKLKSFSG